MNIVTLCTGNVARSVMLGYMLGVVTDAPREPWHIRTAGTHVVEGSAMSSRTRDALLKIEGLGAQRYGSHRSHQVSAEDIEWADIILASESDHVNFVRRHFEDGSTKSVQLVQFVRFAPPHESLDRQLRLTSALDPDSDFDVGDPAGGDQVVYDVCARELWALAHAFSLLVGETF